MLLLGPPSTDRLQQDAPRPVVYGRARQRHLARTVSLFSRSRTDLANVSTAAHREVLYDLTDRAVAVFNEVVQLPVLYCFHNADRDSALAVVLPSLVDLARAGCEHSGPDVRLHGHGAMRLAALEDLSTHLGEAWLEMGTDSPIDAVVDAYATDHLHRIGDPRQPATPLT